VSYLPLSHCAAQFIDIVLSLFSGYQVFFADRSALQETGNLIKTLQEVKPHMFFAVPRIWVKIYDKIVEISKSNDPLIA
jgi:long-chain-fatty-acid--CoA ligase ACSBG